MSSSLVPSSSQRRSTVLPFTFACLFSNSFISFIFIFSIQYACQEDSEVKAETTKEPTILEEAEDPKDRMLPGNRIVQQK